jgi:hypothetical protein
VSDERERGTGLQVAESRLSEPQNARVLLDEARRLSRNLAYLRSARFGAGNSETLDGADRQVGERRVGRG